jgi:Mce-associated membrane protein
MKTSRLRTLSLGRIGRSPYLSWVIAGVAIGLAILFFLLWRGEAGEEGRRDEVAVAATDFLVALTNFSGETIDQDVAEIEAFAVGDFAEEVRTFFNRQAKQALTQARARSVGRVQRVYVQSVSGDSASVFGVLNETVTNRAQQTPRQEVLRIEIDMIETTGGWKVNRVNILQSPGGAGLGGP